MHIANLTESLKKAGYKPILLDLREYIEKVEMLKSELDETDLLWVSGGNVFYLRYLLRESGLDVILKSLIDAGMVYAGDSAGSAVLGHDLHGLDLLDDISEAPEVFYNGLDLTSFIILPHWGNERYQDEIENSKKILEQYNPEVITINDDQACIVDGQSRYILG